MARSPWAAILRRAPGAIDTEPKTRSPLVDTSQLGVLPQRVEDVSELRVPEGVVGGEHRLQPRRLAEEQRTEHVLLVPPILRPAREVVVGPENVVDPDEHAVG